MKPVYCSPAKLRSYLFYLALTFFLICIWPPASGQALRPLAIGERVPDVRLGHLIDYPAAPASMSQFKGKPLILDFWATWCAPCVKMFPRLDSIQQEFSGKIQILSVTYQTEAQVRSFLEKYNRRRQQRITLPGIVSDTTLKQLFLHNTYPHYVWIDASGTVRAFTGMEAVTRENVVAFLKGNVGSMQLKVDTRPISYNIYRPLLVNRNGGDGSNLLYQTVFTGYTPGLGYGYSVLRDSTAHFRITLQNEPRAWFYRIAYSVPGKQFNEANTIYEVADKSKLTSEQTGAEYEAYLRAGNGFCYELAVGLNREKEAFTVMQRDLDFLFPEFVASLEIRDHPCLALRRVDKTIALASLGGKVKIDLGPFEWKVNNAFVPELISRLNTVQRFPRIVVDETGFKERFDLDLPAGSSDLDALNQELAKYGLQLVETVKPLEVLVIKDKIAN